MQDYNKYLKKLGLKFLFYSFMDKYINIVVNQGEGITATLEHLKFFFLNKSAIDKKRNPVALSEYNKNNPTRQLGTIEDGKSWEGDWHYENIDKDVGLKEYVQRGFMKEYRTIEILSKLAGFEGEDPFISSLGRSPPKLQPTTGSRFLMLAAILRNQTIVQGTEKIYDQNSQKKLCKATENTLRLAENLASEPKPIGGKESILNCEDKQDTKYKLCEEQKAAKKKECLEGNLEYNEITNKCCLEDEVYNEETELCEKDTDLDDINIGGGSLNLVKDLRKHLRKQLKLNKRKRKTKKRCSKRKNKSKHRKVKKIKD